LLLTTANVRINFMKSKLEKSKRVYDGIDAGNRTENRKQKLLLSGLEVFGTDGYGKGTIKSICVKAKLTERYFYESFKNKEDLLCEVYTLLIEELRREFEELIKQPITQPKKLMKIAFSQYFKHLRDDPFRAKVQLFEVLGVSQRVDVHYQAAMRIVASEIDKVMCLFFPSAKAKYPDRSILVCALSGAMLQVANEWVLSGYQQPIEEIADQLTDVYMAVGQQLFE
jgi:AcrR family transcriptional regulator